MAKIVVAFSDRQLARQISQGLEASGFEVFRVCSTGSEVMRAFAVCQDGVLICGTRFPDRTADALAWDLEKRALVLVVGKGEQLALCEHPEIYTLRAPFSMRELAASVNMLLQMHSKRLPRRSGIEKSLVDQAKEKLMRERGLTEPEAHQLLQRESMRRGVKMTDSAHRILDEETDVAQ